MNMTPGKAANSNESRIRFAPAVNHQTMKKGFRPVKAKPINNRFFVFTSLDMELSFFDLNELSI
jgi:hypothetical protein